MYEATGKIFLILQLLAALILCALLSAGVLTLAVPFIYGVWHCPPSAPCNTPLWGDLIVLAVLLCPLLIFAIGAYLCRRLVAAAVQSIVFQAVILIIFALFPLICFGGLTTYIALSN